MKIFSGKFEIYSTGLVNSNGLKPTRFSMLDESKFDVIFRVEWDKGESYISYDVTGEGEITFSFFNPDLMDYGFSSPIKIGFLDNRELYVTFRVTTHGEKTSYSLSYTFYLAEEK